MSFLPKNQMLSLPFWNGKKLSLSAIVFLLIKRYSGFCGNRQRGFVHPGSDA